MRSREIAADIDARFKEYADADAKVCACRRPVFFRRRSVRGDGGSAGGLDSKTGAAPASVKLTQIYGPSGGSRTIWARQGVGYGAEVLQAAARIAAPLTNDEWKLIPDNAVPAEVQVGSVRVNASQFLRLMALGLPQSLARQNPSAECHGHDVSRHIHVPQEHAHQGPGNSWTFKPAPLKVESTTDFREPVGHVRRFWVRAQGRLRMSRRSLIFAYLVFGHLVLCSAARPGGI